MQGKHRKHVPLRMCIVCQQKWPKRQLIRIVRTPEGTVEVDPGGKRSGRGAYLCSSHGCWQTALDHAKLARAFGRKLSIEELTELRAAAASLLEEDLVIPS